MIENAMQEFTKYVKSFTQESEIILKYKHTLRVMDLCEKIARFLNLKEEEVEIAKLIGLLHDIGRFEQWSKYHTFQDSKSEDHAELGIRILKEKEYLRKFIENDEYDSIILKSISNHNKFEISKDVTEKEEMFAKIIRDADKLDILNIYLREKIQFSNIFMEEGFENEYFSKEVYESLLQRKQIRKDALKNKIDFLSLSLGFIFDMNYLYSIEYLKEKKYYSLLIEQYKERINNSIFHKQLEEIQKGIEEYIEERLTC